MPVPPVIGLTLGDACGIGPEILLKSLPTLLAQSARWLILGDELILQREAAVLGVPPQWLVLRNEAELLAWLDRGPTNRLLTEPHEARLFSDHAALPAAVLPHAAPAPSRVSGAVLPEPARLALWPCSQLPADLPRGLVDARAGAASYAAVCAGIDFAKQGLLQGLCTAPIHKEAWSLAGVRQPGHTEVLAERCGVHDFGMLLVAGALRVLLVSIHLSLRQAIEQVSVERELEVIRLGHRSLQQWGFANPRIAVAGLNPHAGEGGLFGHEDRDCIAPAIALAQAEGIDVHGPLAGDTVFMRAKRGDFDLVIAQYHDQGLIPIKLGGLSEGVNVTVGLPFIRTSPDHGTAFDLAGRGQADPASFTEAALLALHWALPPERAVSSQSNFSSGLQRMSSSINPSGPNS